MGGSSQEGNRRWVLEYRNTQRWILGYRTNIMFAWVNGHINNVDVDVLQQALWLCAPGSPDPSLQYDTLIVQLEHE